MTEDPRDVLARRFDEHRAHLQAVAYRMLGSRSEADDAVQEAWLRLARADTSDVGNLGGWLTTVVARVCLDLLRSRESRREEPLGEPDREAEIAGTDPDPDHELLLADSVGAALVVVLETLAPAERLAFVLHDVFAVPFDEIARILERSPDAARQLASRARRRVRTAADARRVDVARQRAVVDAFLAASRDGNFAALLSLLAPDVVLRADAAAVAAGATPEVRGADGVARTFAGRARVARPALVDRAVGAVWMAGGQPRVVFAMTIADGRITAIELVADPDRLGTIELELLERDDRA